MLKATCPPLCLCHLKGEGPFSFLGGPVSALTPDVSVTGERTAVVGLDWCGLGKNTPLFWPNEFSGRDDRADLGSVRLQPGLSSLKQFKSCSIGFAFLFDLFVLLLSGITRLLTSYRLHTALDAVSLLSAEEG